MIDTLAVSADREFGYGAADFERVRDLIYRRAGIALSNSKQDLVYSRLARRLRVTGHAEFRQYLDALEAAPESDEWVAFTNALTTNLTSFFREAHHFDTLRDHLRALPTGGRVLLWCCAASTGEEPYSIAMTAVEAYESLHPPVAILATDIDTNVLATGERGVYAMERVAALESARLKRFFRRGTGANEGQCRVIDELRQLISFRPLNLQDPEWGLRGPFSAVFCRNVMIYFDKPTQERLLRRFLPLIGDDGLLFTGHSETLVNAPANVQSIGRTTYRKRAGVAVRS